MLICPLFGFRSSFGSAILLTVAVSLVLATAGAGTLIWPLWASYRYTNSVVALDARLGEITVALAQERGLTAISLAADANASDDSQARLHGVRQRANNSFDDTLRALGASDVGSGLDHRKREVQLLRDRLAALRREADAAISRPAAERDRTLLSRWVAASTELIEACQHLRLAAMRSTRGVEDLEMLQYSAWSGPNEASLPVDVETWFAESAGGSTSSSSE